MDEVENSKAPEAESEPGLSDEELTAASGGVKGGADAIGILPEDKGGDGIIIFPQA